MYQPLGNLYTSQRLGSFESDDTSFGQRRGRGLTVEQLTNRLARKEMRLLKLQHRAAAGNAHAAKTLAKLEPHVAELRAELASRKNPDVLNGLSGFDMGGLNCLQLGVGALIGAGIYWFGVRRFL